MSAFAFVTVVALGIEPSAQQILGIGTREIELVNVTAGVGMARAYSSKGGQELQQRPGPRNTYTYSDPLVPRMVMGAMLGFISPTDLYCPPSASRCTWQDYTTLSVCLEIKNVTDSVTSSCTWGDGLGSCVFTFPGMKNFSSPLSLTLTEDKVEQRSSWTLNLLGPLILTGTRISGGVAFAAVDVSGARMTENTLGTWSGLAAYSGQLFWCSRTVHGLSVVPGEMPLATVDDEPLSFIDDEYTTEHDPFRYYHQYRANSTGIDFWLDRVTDYNLWDFLQSVFLLNNLENVSDPPGHLDRARNALNSLTLLDNLHGVVKNISQSVSNHINLIGGNNANVTKWVGKAYINTPCYTVRWAWLILPLAETAVGAVLMGVTIALSRDGPLWRLSAIATLFHGLEYRVPDDKSPGEKNSKTYYRETDEKLKKMATRYQVRLSPNKTDQLKLIVEHKTVESPRL